MRTAVIGAGVATVCLLVAFGVVYLDPSRKGLRAEYFVGSSTSAPMAIAMSVMPTSASFESAGVRVAGKPFTATLTGSLVVPRGGRHTFLLGTDGPSTLFIDGQPVVARVAGAGPEASRGIVVLGRGFHTLFVQYAHEAGDVRFDVQWARESETAQAIPSWKLRPPGAGGWELGLSLTLVALLIVAEWVWVASLLGVVTVFAARGLQRFKHRLEEEQVWRPLRWILGVSVALNATALWWGLPAYWAPDELTPTIVLDALSQHFSHGWFDRYPPFHYYVLTSAMGPVLLLQALGRIDMYSGFWPLVLIVVLRVVSLVAGTGIVAIVSIVGARTFGRRAGFLGAAIFALVAPFVYYAKTANLDVPYLFWFALSLLPFLRLLGNGTTRDFVLFATLATLAICTKDQAYGLYVLTPVVIGYHLYRQGQEKGLAWWRWVIDRRLAAAVVTAVVVFGVVHNLVFNSGGFWRHVEFLVGPGSEGYRAVPPTLVGRLALLVQSGHLVKISWGWPLTLIGAAGVGLALALHQRRWTALALLTPVLSYYLTFINVILYNYDRFVMPICLVLAVFGGYFLDRFLPGGRLAVRSWRGAFVAAAFAYTLLYTATVDVLMLTDGRHEVERWMREHVGETDIIGVSGPAELRPRLPGPAATVTRIRELEVVRPAFYILSADYVRAVRTDSEWGQLIAGLQQHTLGYELALRYRRPSPWPWLPDAHPDLVGPRTIRSSEQQGSAFDVGETGVFSILRSVNPTIEVFHLKSPRADER